MTVTANSRRREYSGNGVATVFNGPMSYVKDYVLVFLVSPDGVSSQVATSQYSVERIGFSSGTRVTMAVAPATGWTLVILRTMPYTQETDITNQGAFHAETLEKGFDSLGMQIQQIADGVSRSLRFGDSEALPPGISTVMPNPGPLLPLVWSADGTRIENGNLDMTGDMLLRPNIASGTDNLFRLDSVFAASRGIIVRMRDTVSVKDFLCSDGLPVQGDGIHDDTTGIQRGINYVAANGGILYFPAGEYKTTANIGASSAAQAFTLRGAGWSATRIVRGAVTAGNVIQLANVSNVTVEDLTVVCSYAAFPVNANHGIAFFNGSHIRIRRVKVFDFKASGIIGYTFPANSSYSNCLIEDCFVDGGGLAGNGILIADLSKSGIRNCSAVNIGKVSTPCYALQMKNGCQESFIEGGYAEGAIIGVAIGNYDISGTHTKNRVSGVRVFNCDTGIGLGTNLGDNISDCLIDMNAGGLSAIDFQENSKGCSVTGITVRNHVTTRGIVRFRNNDTDNYVEIDNVENASGNPGIVAEYLPGSARNNVILRRHVNAGGIANSQALVGDTSTGSTNVFTYDALPNRQASVIASDAATVRHAKIASMQVDTEAAAATDNLATINGGTDGQTLTVNQAANSRDVTIKHGTGNIRLNGAVDFAFTTVQQNVTLMYLAGVSQWVEVSRGTAT